MLSVILSSSGSQLMNKWQFWRKTQYPFCIASSIIWAAFEPCPCPSESMRVFLSIFDF